MPDVTLLASTGVEQVDQTIRAIVGLVELSFPDRVRGDPATLAFPLDYPDPTGALYGYDQRYRDGDRPDRVATKDLVTNVLAAANALTWLAAKQYVGSGKKRDIPEQYRLWIGDEWSTLVEDVFEWCRVRWGYLEPESPADRARLGGLCERALAFENHFLLRYKDFLLAELRDPDQAVRPFAARRLGQIVYPDSAVAAALRAALRHGGAQLRAVAAEALRQYAVSS